MTHRHDFLARLAVGGAALPSLTLSGLAHMPAPAPTRDTRAYWVDVLGRIADPVLTNLAERRLRERMPDAVAATATPERRRYAALEAFGRLLTGIAPWLALEADASVEGALRSHYAELARAGIDAATDPASPDFMNFTSGSQPLVDAAFLAHAIVRAPRELHEKLPSSTRRNLITALVLTRTIKPGFNNWLLFSAMVETALSVMGAEWDRMRVDYAVRQHEQWYKGDGMYGDGPTFHWDYYNSYVIQPMLLDILGTLAPMTPEWKPLVDPVVLRAKRYAAIQERLISPEGTFPPIGRSLAYRFGAFQLLGQMALRRQLPDAVSPAQVRSALSAVIGRMIEAPGTFDGNGWLTVGFAGRQPHIGETYISSGSVYLCAAGLLPLGLPATDPFWMSPSAEWTSKKVWSGLDTEVDHAI
jgi:hypothetical protein